MHSSTLLTSALAVGALALPQGQLEKRQQATVFTTVTATVTVFVNPYATPAWTPPQLPQTPNTRRPTNAPPVWTPPQVGATSNRATLAPVNTIRTSSSTTSRPAVPTTSSRPVVAPVPSSSSAYTPPVVGPISNRPTSSSSVVAPRPSSTILTPIRASSSSVNVPGASSSATPTTAPSSGAPLDPGHIPGVGQASLSAGLDYQNSILFHHNRARANHDAAPLVWDDTCAQTAALAAQTCRFEHYIPEGAGQGQNLFTVSGNSFNVTAGITDSWYKGEFPPMLPYFGQANIPDNVFHDVGHLTQVVWKGTTKVGCVSIDCGNRMIVGGASSTLNKYTVCNYAPAGNVYGQYDVNVGRPRVTNVAALGSWRD